MIVERIESLSAFERIRSDYERVYAADPYRTVFVSWSWLRSFVAAMRRRWTLLAVRDGDEYVAFLFFVTHTAGLGPLRFYRELGLGAYPTADYTSLVIAREERAAIQAFAAALRAMRWDVIRARSIRDPRIAQLIDVLGDGNVVRREESTTCHVVPLPESWSAFAETSPRKKSLRYAIRRMNAWSGATFTLASDDTIERDVEALLALHHERWKSNLRKARRTYGRLFKEAYRRGCCRVGVLWSENGMPLAAQAAFTDPECRSWGIYMLAYDRSSSHHSPGIGMLMRGIERAISERFSEYDFLRGDEAYKARFGSQVRLLENFTISRPSRRSQATERVWSATMSAKRTVRNVLVGGVRASA